MKTNATCRWLVILLLIIIGTGEVKSQNKWAPYLNAGYVTNLKKGPDSKRADTGGSVRIGVLHNGLFDKGRLGLYLGYIWFQEYNADYVDYNDSGKSFIAGIDFRLLRIKNFKWYIKIGLGPEKYISTYSNHTESEMGIKPDLGFLFNYRYINFYAGWHPSEPSHINFGIGFTLYGSTNRSNFEY